MAICTEDKNSNEPSRRQEDRRRVFGPHFFFAEAEEDEEGGEKEDVFSRLAANAQNLRSQGEAWRSGRRVFSLSFARPVDSVLFFLARSLFGGRRIAFLPSRRPRAKSNTACRIEGRGRTGHRDLQKRGEDSLRGKEEGRGGTAGGRLPSTVGRVVCIKN